MKSIENIKGNKLISALESTDLSLRYKSDQKLLKTVENH
jgi:hypothetical protein